MTTLTHARLGALLCATILAASCSSGSGSDDSDVATDESTSPIVAQGASYELTTELPQRVIVCLLDNDNNLVSFGEVEFA